ncbi:MAG: helix-turn-helix transcriptional regulator [bacterium]|nr:helix-turn-helix transcriptional regulator [bacterium]
MHVRLGSQDIYSKIERGDRKPTMQELEAIASALDVSLHDFLLLSLSQTVLKKNLKLFCVL